MSSWNMGYHTDHLYTYGYYRENNPLYAKFVLTTSGFSCPDMSKGYACELGFGQGVSIVMNAASSELKWSGTDFNPSQVNFAKQLAQTGNIKLHLTDNAFGEFAQRRDLPMFDFICMHGIWSWINHENQEYIVDFVRDHLKDGGVLYISYNISPRFLDFEPVRHLMYEYNKHVLPRNMDGDERINSLINFLDNIIQTKPVTLEALPKLQSRIDKLKSFSHNYIFAEYLNDNWDVTHFTYVAKRLERANMSFACTASVEEHLNRLYISLSQQRFLSQLQNTSLHETAYNFMIYAQFRRDFFVKSQTQLTPEQQKEEIAKLNIILTTPKNEINYKCNLFGVEVNLKQEIYKPIFYLLSDNKVHNVGQLISTLLKNRLHAKLSTESQILNALCTLIYTNKAEPAVAPEQISPTVIAQCRKLNHEILCSNDFSPINYLASPVIQGGIYIDKAHQCLLSLYVKISIDNPNCTQEYVADAICKELEQKNLNLVFKSKEITDSASKQKIIAHIVNTFLDNDLVMYRELMLI